MASRLSSMRDTSTDEEHDVLQVQHQVMLPRVYGAGAKSACVTRCSHTLTHTGAAVLRIGWLQSRFNMRN